MAIDLRLPCTISTFRIVSRPLSCNVIVEERFSWAPQLGLYQVVLFSPIHLVLSHDRTLYIAQTSASLGPHRVKGPFTFLMFSHSFDDIPSQNIHTFIEQPHEALLSCTMTYNLPGLSKQTPQNHIEYKYMLVFATLLSSPQLFSKKY